MKREVYFVIRFSDELVEKLGDEGLKKLVKKWKKEALPKLTEMAKQWDKKAKCWIKLY